MAARSRSLRDLRTSFHFERLEDLCTPIYELESTEDIYSPDLELQKAAHAIANNLDQAFDEQEIELFLTDESRVLKLLKEAFSTEQNLYENSHQIESNEDHVRPIITPCAECNEDGRGGRQLGESNNISLLVLPHQLHNLNISLSVLCHLVTRQDSEMLLDLFFSATVGDLMPQQALRLLQSQVQTDENERNQFIKCLLMLMSKPHLSRAYPTAHRLALSLMSLIVCRRPTTAFSPERTIGGSEAISEAIVCSYWEAIAQLNNAFVDRNSDDSADLISILREYIGFINIVPALYCMGVVKQVRESDLFRPMVTVLLRFLHCSVQFCPPFIRARLNSMVDHPRLTSAIVAMKPMLLRDGEDEERRLWRIRLLQKDIGLFAPAATLELFGWWVSNDPSLLHGTHEIVRDREKTVSEILSGISEELSLVQRETEDLAYIGPILDDLLAGNVPGIPPKDKSLLNGPLMDANRHCGLPSCRSACGVSGSDLLRCAGGCRGLEHYCCRTHQQVDWRRHKIFCKSNR